MLQWMLNNGQTLVTGDQSISVTSGQQYNVGAMLTQLTPTYQYTITLTKDGANFASAGPFSLPSGGGAFPITPVNTTDTGNKYVHYILSATADGPTNYMTVKVIVPDTIAPSIPANLHTTSVAWNQIGLQWNASTDNQMIDHYDVSVNGTVVSTATSPGTATNYILSGLTQTTNYTIKVQSWDWAGNPSGWSTPLSVTTPVHDTTPPSQPGTLVQSNPTTTGFTVTWGTSTDDVSVAGYTVKLLQGGVNGTLISTQNVAASTLTFTFSGLTAGTTYGVSVVAYDAVPNVSTARTGTFSTSTSGSGSQPGQPTGLSAINATTTGMTISWNAAVDGHAVANYVIDINGTDTTVGQDGSGHPLTSYTYSGLSPGTMYQFKVKAVDPSNNSSLWSDILFAATVTPLVTLPATVPPPAGSSAILVATTGPALSVDNHGSANVSIPLQIAPSRSGPQPELSLQYSSSAGNGLLGVGFSVSTGFPHSIVRGRSILARDGQVQGVTFTSGVYGDKFYLDGKRLLCVSGAEGQANSTYRTEVDSFVTVVASGAGTDIETFVMTDKSGRQFTFGKSGTVDGFQQGGEETSNVAYEYALKQVTDTLGNYITFTYQNLGGGEYVLSHIDYTGGTGISPGASVQFAYSARSDQATTFLANRSFAHRARLALITAMRGTTTTAAYSLNYDNAPNGGRSRLLSVAPFLADPTSQALQTCPLLNVGWQNNANQFSSTSSYAGSGPNNQVQWADTDNNGKDEPDSRC